MRYRCLLLFFVVFTAVLVPRAAVAERIILFGDSVSMKRLVFMQLVQLGYQRNQLYIAETDKLGLRELREKRYELVIYLIGRQSQEAETFLRELRKHWKTLPVLLLANVRGEAKAKKLLHAGAQDYLLEPFRPEQLKTKLRGLLE